MAAEKTIVTADGATLKVGDRAFNYYDCKWGKIEEINRHDDWFTFRHEDGTSAVLNGERISKNKPTWMK
jgi:hypothetical protein